MARVAFRTTTISAGSNCSKIKVHTSIGKRYKALDWAMSAVAIATNAARQVVQSRMRSTRDGVSPPYRDAWPNHQDELENPCGKRGLGADTALSLQHNWCRSELEWV